MGREELKTTHTTNQFLSLISKVVDTPDIKNLQLDPEEKRQQVSQWKNMTSPVPHAILLTVNRSNTYTNDEFSGYKEIKKLWGNDDQFCQRLIVAFTFEDCQGDPEAELKTVCPELQSVLKDAGNRYVLFDNKADPRKREDQVRKLHDLLNDMPVLGTWAFFFSFFGSSLSRSTCCSESDILSVCENVMRGYIFRTWPCAVARTL